MTSVSIPGHEEWICIPEYQWKELQFLREVNNVNWVGVSPSVTFEPGENKGIILGKDELLLASDGASHTTTGTMAAAILDELEHPIHHQVDGRRQIIRLNKRTSDFNGVPPDACLTSCARGYSLLC